jgi:hypothetical protein
MEQRRRADRYHTWKEDMRMYICTFPRMRTLAILFAAFAAVQLGQPSFAQNSRSNGSAAQAELHINVIVVPVVLPPRDHRHRDRDRDRDRDSVSYDLSPQEDRLSVIEEVRPMLVTSAGNFAKEEQVRVVTVIVK